MKSAYPILLPEQTVAALAHMAWCAQVALRPTQRDGQALSPLTTHAFLLRWLVIARKQRRFPRAITPDIESLLKSGRQKGPLAMRQQRLELLCTLCSSTAKQKSDLFRLTHAVEALKAQGWINAAVVDAEWDILALLSEYTDVHALLVKKSDLMRYFAEEGQLTGTITFVVKGAAETVAAAFSAQALLYTTETTVENYARLTLLPA